MHWKNKNTMAMASDSVSVPIYGLVLTRRVLQTLAVALRRVNASRILQFRRRAINAQRGEEAAEELAGV